jgi:hypothetical protein
MLRKDSSMGFRPGAEPEIYLRGGIWGALVLYLTSEGGTNGENLAHKPVVGN